MKRTQFSMINLNPALRSQAAVVCAHLQLSELNFFTFKLAAPLPPTPTHSASLLQCPPPRCAIVIIIIIRPQEITEKSAHSSSKKPGSSHNLLQRPTAASSSAAASLSSCSRIAVKITCRLSLVTDFVKRNIRLFSIAAMGGFFYCSFV